MNAWNDGQLLVRIDVFERNSHYRYGHDEGDEFVHSLQISTPNNPKKRGKIRKRGMENRFCRKAARKMACVAFLHVCIIMLAIIMKLHKGKITIW